MFKRLGGIVAMLALSISSHAHADVISPAPAGAVPTDSVRLSWGAVTQGTDAAGKTVGLTTPVTYDVLRRANGVGDYTTVGSGLKAVSALDKPPSAGNWCYALIARTGTQTSAKSADRCKVTRAAGPPPVVFYTPAKPQLVAE